jgi:hypothetical protein
MRKFFLIVLVAVFSVLQAGLCFSEEKRDHVCFRVVDADKNGEVTFEEFQKHFGEDKSLFESADLDKSGTLSHEEYHSLLGHGAA